MPYQSNYLPHNMPIDTAMRQRNIAERMRFGRTLSRTERDAIIDANQALAMLKLLSDHDPYTDS